MNPLFAALAKSAHLSHSIGFSRRLFSYSYALFCLMEKGNSLISNRFRTLLPKMGDVYMGGTQKPKPLL
jgi:hypothetical protein